MSDLQQDLTAVIEKAGWSEDAGVLNRALVGLRYADDRIAALEAELGEARMQGLAAAGQAQDHMEKMAALVAENERLRELMAPMAVSGVGPDGKWRAVPLEDWLASAAPKENDNA